MCIQDITIVLLVDPDKEYREKVGRTLEDFTEMKFQVLWASSIKEAVEAIAKLPPAVIVSDLNLLDSKGSKTLAMYFNKAKGVPLVILTDEETAAFEEDGKKKGVEAFLSKAETPAEQIGGYLQRFLDKEEEEEGNELEGVRVLIIDDDATTRYIQSDYLKQEGCLVEEAEDGFMALATLRKNAITGNQFDIVIVDLMMPNMDGFEFLSTIRKRAWGKEIPLLVSSSRNDSEAIMKCKFSNVKGYIIKPARRDVLLSKVIGALADKKKKKD